MFFFKKKIKLKTNAVFLTQRRHSYVQSTRYTQTATGKVRREHQIANHTSEMAMVWLSGLMI